MNFLRTSFFFFLVMYSSLSLAAVPVTSAKNQQQLLKNADPTLAQNKKIAYDFFRVILAGRHSDQVKKYMREDYIQHNPNVETGTKGFCRLFFKIGWPQRNSDGIERLNGHSGGGRFCHSVFR